VFWQARRQQAGEQQQDEQPAADYAAAPGRHRLSDGDVVPVPGYRTFREILNDPTRELPVVDTNDPLRMTPGQEHRSGRRRWLP
jgi:hypothetical protein